MDNLFEQIVNISKAGAYDVVREQVVELKAALEQILIHASVENQIIAKEDANFGADELQAIRIKAIKALYSKL